METLEDIIERLYGEGYSYSYIEGYRKGYDFLFSSREELEDYLTELRNNGEDYEYIDGFRASAW